MARDLVLTSSRVSDFYDCETKHQAKWSVKRWSGGGKSETLDLGTAAHQVFQRALMGITPIKSELRWDVERELEDLRAKSGLLMTKANEAKQIGEWLRRWWEETPNDARPWDQVLAVEKVIRAKLAEIDHRGERVNIWIQGSLDALVRGRGAFVGSWAPLEVKTRSFEYKDNVGAYREFADWRARHWQTLFYTWLAQRAAQKLQLDKVDGFVLFTVDKAPHKCKDGRIRDVKEAVHVEFLPADAAAIQLVLRDAMRTARRILTQEDELTESRWDPSLAPYALPATQTGRQHNCKHPFYGLCPLKAVCDMRAPITEPFLFGDVNPWEHYGDNEVLVVDEVEDRGGRQWA